MQILYEHTAFDNVIRFSALNVLKHVTVNLDSMIMDITH